ncbi:MAG: AAA domain-containing protein [Chloroherpetonaceae bacterium]|nr:AAA domain-containing protein [Chloroherpetonaceae bacterium]MDW8437871.1 AAA domain-containing protein [Chloroherpetonaceae bacterium]
MPFDNETLQALLDSVIDHRRCAIQSDESKRDYIEEMLKKLPMPLSENQRLAIINAYTCSISYVQGPPGTGKSHTITAMMLAALLLNKKVLLISHKPAAIQVVRDRVNRFLNNDYGIVVIQGDPEKRRMWRGYIQRLIQEAQNAQLDRQANALSDLQRAIERLENELREKQARFRRLIEQARSFYKANEDFIRVRDAFAQDFRRISRIALERAFSNVSPQADLEKCLRAISKARQIFSRGTAIARKDAIFLLALHKAMATRLGADYDALKSHGAQYGERHIELLKAFFETERHRLAPDADLSILRTETRRIAERIAEERRKFLQLSFEQSRLRNARSHKDDMDAFQRMLRNVAPRLIREKLSQINFHNLTTAFPLWACELRYVSRWIPMQSKIFDLVVIDEASQVNLAEALPAFYRGKSICVVGDDKQLNLASVGLFKLNKTFESLSWNRNFPNISFEEAKERKLLASEASILDFIIAPENQLSVPRITLNEHFRSLPQLAKFTSDFFYEDNGGLRIMTELPEHCDKPSFEAIYVDGEREENEKVVPKEIEAAANLVEKLIEEKTYLSEPLSRLGFTEQKPPSIGVLAFLTDTKNALLDAISARIRDDDWQKHELFVATTEEFQGNERDIMIIVAGLGKNSSFGATHFENPNRFNVATSRAKKFAYFVYGGIPDRAQLVKKYLRHFGYEPNANPDSPPDASFAIRKDKWGYNPALLKSEFERRIAEHLSAFAREHHLALFNQVESCGYRLEFALYNPSHNKCLAIEIDGQSDATRDYYEEQLERAEVLRRAGWKITYIPYHKWYRNGWLRQDDPTFLHEVTEPLFDKMRTMLFDDNLHL